ncbi:lipopolysaccharide-induced tumor necrosis factor-alpha factor homolog [Lytechinus pictus]|uniref:lipopolysaccharide-induced tumor necrosis factor-alpha factor homolog n=1 Tax=Lytechinus pictus TaxID=7653 RepID=UPI0030B9CEA4
MSAVQGPPPQGQDKSQEVGGMQAPPPYTQAVEPSSYPTNPGYPTQPPPASGYPVQPPAGGYQAQPPPAVGYPAQLPPAAGYPAQPPPMTVPPYTGQPQGVDPSNVVIVNQPGVLVHHHLLFRDVPVACTCPNCHNQVTSNVRREVGGLTLLIMGALCIFGLWLFCCLIPLCIDACKDAVHTCPVCNHQLGRWNQL